MHSWLPLFQSLLDLTSGFQILILTRGHARLFPTVESIALYPRNKYATSHFTKIGQNRWLHYRALCHQPKTLSMDMLPTRTDVPAHLLKHVLTIRCTMSCMIRWFASCCACIKTAWRCSGVNWFNCCSIVCLFRCYCRRVAACVFRKELRFDGLIRWIERPW